MCVFEHTDSLYDSHCQLRALAVVRHWAGLQVLHQSQQHGLQQGKLLTPSCPGKWGDVFSVCVPSLASAQQQQVL